MKTIDKAMQDRCIDRPSELVPTAWLTMPKMTNEQHAVRLSDAQYLIWNVVRRNCGMVLERYLGESVS